MKVLITDKINEQAGNILKDTAQVDILPTMPEDELAQKIADYDALMVRSQTKVTKKIIESAKNLKIIGRAGVGVDNIDIEAATQKGIIVVNSPDGNTNAAAEHTLAMMLAMSRNIPKAVCSTKQGLWERSKFTGCEVFGKTLGIIGFGKIGAHVGKVALALGMDLVVYDPFTTQEIVEKFGAKYVSHLDDFWGVCDYITIHTPKTKETMYLINKNSLNRMKKGVKIINCARGGIIDEQALLEAIEANQVSAAAIDVYENEPDIKSSPLLKAGDNVILTPHLGASTSEAQINVALDVAEQIKDVLEGKSARSAVNIPSLKPAKLEAVKDYVKLTQNRGEIAIQLSKGNLKSIEIKVSGNLADVDVAPLEVILLKGIFSQLMEGVNFVNAPLIAKQRGIKVTTTKSNECDYIGEIEVKITDDKKENIIKGALIAENIGRIVQINEYAMSMLPENHMILIPHENKPSMIAKVAAVLGDGNINITRMNCVQKINNDDNISLMIISVETPVQEDLLGKISKIDGITEAKYLNLNA